MWWFNWFNNKPLPPIESTQEEENMILSYMNKGQCPDCRDKTTFWIHGPEATVCINVKCANCGARFNTMMGGSKLVYAERI